MLRTWRFRSVRVVLVLLAISFAANLVTVEDSAIDSGAMLDVMPKQTSDRGAGVPPQREPDFSGSHSGPLPTGFVDREVQTNGATRRYVVYEPIDYSRSRSWPAILFLHGRGESGSDGRRQLTQGLAPAILKRPAAWPFVVIFPQKSHADVRWTDETAMLAAILDAVEASYRLDPTRRYVTGLSQGGHGTLALATHLPWRFAALATVCGWADDPAATAAAIGPVPVWVFHGEDDPVVPVRRSLEVVEALRRAGGQPRLTRYTAVGHDAWNLAYSDENLPKWLLSHHRAL